MKREILTKLVVYEYEHPLDRETKGMLEDTPGLSSLTKTAYTYHFDKVNYQLHSNSYININRDQLPDVYDIFLEACSILDISDIPQLYLVDGPGIQAYTTCASKPIIAINPNSLRFLSRDEILFILGHELGHVKSQHVFYSVLAENISIISSTIGSVTLGVGSVLSQGLRVALMRWYRMAELTADRTGLLACQNYDTALSVLSKLSAHHIEGFGQINLKAFERQALKLDVNTADNYDKVAKVMAYIDNTHPWSAVRVKMLKEWYESRDYKDILDRTNAEANHSIGWIGEIKCSSCSIPLETSDRFCPKCGQQVVTVP